MSFVEGALERCSPGPVFTHAVMAAIIGVTHLVQAAGARPAAAKVGSTLNGQRSQTPSPLCPDSSAASSPCELAWSSHEHRENEDQ